MSEKEFEANEIKTQHIYSSNDDDSIMIGGDLIPDDTDMSPRMIGSDEAPFRDIFADTFRGCVEPNGQFGTIGANRPFDRIVAKDLVAERLNGVPFPGMLCGYGWFVAHVSNDKSSVLHTSFLHSAIACSNSSDGSTVSVKLHPSAPSTGFVAGQDVFVEITQFGHVDVGVDVPAKTMVRRLTPYLNARKQTEISIDMSISASVSVDYMLIVKVW